MGFERIQQKDGNNRATRKYPESIAYQQRSTPHRYRTVQTTYDNDYYEKRFPTVNHNHHIMGNIHFDSIDQPPTSNYDSIYNYKPKQNNPPLSTDKLTGNFWTNTNPKNDFLESNVFQTSNHHPLLNTYTTGNDNPTRHYQQSSTGQSATYGQTSNQNTVNNPYTSDNYLSTRAKQIMGIQQQDQITRDESKRNYNPSIYYPQTIQILATKYRSENTIPPTKEPILTPLPHYQPTRCKCTNTN